jgi:ribosome-associated toxin RatA of RatAB toxin-antitoxin module
MEIHCNHTEAVKAPAETLFDVITERANYPSFNSSLIKVTVVTKNERGAERRSLRSRPLAASPRPRD